jgi:(S)-mandelate dehydrogenase
VPTERPSPGCAKTVAHPLGGLPRGGGRTQTAVGDVEAWRHRARSRLPRAVFDYVDGGAEAELALAANRRALDAVALVPRVLRDVSRRDTSMTLFGTRHALPLVIAPTGCNGLIHRDGDVLLARAAAAAGIPFALSTAANATIETVARATGTPPWFQLYVTERALAERLVASADAAGCPVLMLTVDVPVGGKRLRDRRNGFALPLRWSPRLVADLACHPRWLVQMRDGVPPFANLAAALGEADPQRQAGLLARNMDASFCWDDLSRLRARWPRTLVVKGILHADDARRALECGADGIVVSNHGGRQLDASPAPADVLPAIVDAVGGRLAVLADGGVRRGEDVLKLLALGADAVLLGRATLYGLAAAGERGVAAVLASLRDDLDRGMALCGAATLAAVRALDAVRRPF